MVTTPEGIPQRQLYTRLRPSPGRGVGVFAIRAIPRGTNPFEGDIGPMVRFPLAAFQQIEDPEVRRIYLDFCPLVDGAFIAPSDLNQITLSWYMNHSDAPNVASDRSMTFTAARVIHTGEELTVDYTTFSDHAARHVQAWT